MAGFWRDFEKALHEKQEVRPAGKGWLTFDELLAKYPGASPRRMRQVLIETNADRFKGIALTPSGRLNQKVWYRCK